MSNARRSKIAAYATATLMISQVVAGKAARDAIFLGHYPASMLPTAVMAGAVVSVIATVAMSGAMARFAPTRLGPLLFGVTAGAYGLNAWLLDAAPEIGAMALYVQTAALVPLLVTGFWSIVNERFDPHTARSAVARVSAFATFGGVVGGAIANLVPAAFGVDAMLPTLALLNVLGALALLGVGRPEWAAAHEPAPAGLHSGFQSLGRNDFLRRMLLLIALCGLGEALLDYAFKSEAADRFAAGEPLIRFFALFYAITGLLTFVVQASLGEKLLQKVGLGGTMAVLPAVGAISGLVASVAPGVGSVTLTRGATALLRNSLFTAGFQLLYTPIRNEDRRPAKPYVEVGGDRIGDFVGGALLMGLLAMAPSLPTGSVMALGVTVFVATWLLVRRLEHGYVNALGDSLKRGAVDLDASMALDATTARTIAGQGGMGRSDLLARVQAYLGEDAPDDASGATQEPEGERPEDPDTRALLARIRTLRTGSAEAVGALLAQSPAEPELVPHAIQRLEDPAVRGPLIDWLRRAAPRAAGQIVDALLDPRTPEGVRRRLPAALDRCPSDRALDGLRRGLSDPDFEVRARCARTAVRLIREQPALRLPSEQVFGLVQAELRHSGRAPEIVAEGEDDPTAASVLVGRRAATRIPPRVDHAFTLLALGLDRSLLRAALRGLYAGDALVRGTAIEYLESTLPDDVLGALREVVEAGPSGRHPRSRKQIAEDLLRATALEDEGDDL